MSRPFESDLTVQDDWLIGLSKQDVVNLLRRVANDLDRFNHRWLDDDEAVRLAAASRAVHAALVELEPIR